MSQDLLIRTAIAVLILPLLSFLALIFFGKRLSRGGDWLGTSILFVCLALSAVVMVQKLTVIEQAIVLSFRWIDFGAVPVLGSLQVYLGITIDNLSAIMLVVVCLVSSLVHLFSIGYMKGDIRYSRYFAYLGVFTFSMLVIVLTNNFFTMYVGWELVGLSSYLLIGHWYEKKSAADASKKAFVVNRVGDIGMFTGIMILYATFRTFGFAEIFGSMAAGQIPLGSEAWLTAAGILIFCGAIGKSAQFPLHVWLPDAMEGPTPVSALIHAATMVAAGVYLVARTFPMMTADALVVIAYIGAITAFISATIAIAQNDIKKVLAYSTISQLGYMIMGLGVGAYTAGFFHLVTHAMFKAGLFLGSGSVIHAMHHALHHQHDHTTDPQDIRNMGGLRGKMPITFLAFLVYTLAISGVPFTSGFLSKDSILAGTLAFGDLTGHWLIPIVGFFVAGLTAFYMFRLVILTFFGEHVEHHRYEHIHESPKVMTIPLIVFAILSFFIFYSFNPIDASEGWFTHAIERPVSVVPASVQAATNEVFEAAHHHAHMPAMVLSLLVAGTGILLAFATYQWKKISADAWAARFSGVYNFLLNKWYFDELYDAVVIGGTLAFTRFLRWFDNTIVDGIVNGTASWTKAVVFGYSDHAKEKRLSAAAFLFVGTIVSLLVAYWIGQWFWGRGEVTSAIVMALVSFALTLYFFWSGAGGFDRNVVDGLVNGVGYFSSFFGILFQKLQTGRVQTYIAFVIFGVMVLFYMFR
ncbi:MAG: NADH-quinone oxidoreductase subunit L [Ignavibacteriae bacterium]|nr:NADH-quinone oxidoreductase subunit L [Ignavibacteria bacterium]MBI3363964.1 NADH-quinone oxidoreductase subunit L [Ignavibacteriota bacterium]